MSDPEQNRWFRRRWSERPNVVAPVRSDDAVALDDGLTLTGLALLQDWRAQRGPSGAGRR